MDSKLVDAASFIDDFLQSPSPSPVEVSDFGESLALLEAPEISPPSETFAELSASELSSLLGASDDPVADDSAGPRKDSDAHKAEGPLPAVNGSDLDFFESITPSAPSSPSRSDCSESYKRRRTGPYPGPCESASSAPSAGPSRVTELEHQLKLSAEENGRLRQRVAAVVQENRSLHERVEELGKTIHALQTGLQAAHAAVVSKGGEGLMQPMMVGLAHVSKEVAKQLGGMVVIGGPGRREPRGKKRRRKAGGITMACVLFLVGALIGMPGFTPDRTGPMALPQKWGNGLVPIERFSAPPTPQLCAYMMRSLPPAVSEGGGAAPGTIPGRQRGPGSLFVSVDDDTTASIVRKRDKPTEDTEFSYILCRDSRKAAEGVQSCLEARRNGQPCVDSHSISLIMPLSPAAFDEDENETMIDAPATLAEVRCKISSVRALTVPTGSPASTVGRVIATR